MARATAGKAEPRTIPRRVAAGFFACAAPDLDFVIGLAGPVEYLTLHRGPTHSFLLLPFWALVFSWILAKILREPRGWRALYGVTALGIFLHILGDLITSFGTMIFWPVSDMRPGLGSTFIIDLWLSGIIVAGLLFSAFFRKSRIPSITAAAALAGLVSFQTLQKQKALEFGAEYARSRNLAGARIAAHPRAVSAWNWTVFVSDERAHHFAHVNLVRDTPRTYQEGDGFVAKLDSAFRPLAQARWEVRSRYGEAPAAKEAWNSPAMEFMRWFAEQPAFDGAAAGSECYWFVDLRFLNPGRDWIPFQFGACRDSAATPWRAVARPETGR